jgi:hypothetical protein
MIAPRRTASNPQPADARHNRYCATCDRLWWGTTESFCPECVAEASPYVGYREIVTANGRPELAPGMTLYELSHDPEVVERVQPTRIRLSTYVDKTNLDAALAARSEARRDHRGGSGPAVEDA